MIVRPKRCSNSRQIARVVPAVSAVRTTCVRSVGFSSCLYRTLIIEMSRETCVAPNPAAVSQYVEAWKRSSKAAVRSFRRAVTVVISWALQWKSGRPVNSTEPTESRLRRPISRAVVRTFSCGMSAPLGGPVVPLV